MKKIPATTHECDDDLSIDATRYANKNKSMSNFKYHNVTLNICDPCITYGSNFHMCSNVCLVLAQSEISE